MCGVAVVVVIGVGLAVTLAGLSVGDSVASWMTS